MNFQFLINPIKLETFFSEYYQKKHLHIKRTDKNYFRGILSMENIDNYLSRNDVYYPALRIVKNGKELDNSLYLKNDSFGQYGLVDMDKLFEQYCTNSTVVFQAFQRSLDTLRELCLNMHEQTSINFSANIYMTPCASRGFNYHYDTHDVIILQTYGKKKFYLYDTPVHLPTKQQGHNQSEEFKKKDYKTEKPIFEEVLEAGDVLYIPRGLVHNAESLENTSLHCTLGFFPQKWHDLFANLNSKITFIDEFRQTIPFIYEEADINKIKIHFQNIVSKALKDDYFDSILKSFINYQINDNRIYDNRKRLLDIENINSISLDTKINVRSQIKMTSSQNEEQVNIHYYGKDIWFPLFMKKSINYLISNKTFKVSQLPDDIDDESKILFVQKLIKEGLITTINE